MNRDERRTRAPATPPERRTLDGVPVLAPRDGEAGGTWIAVNAFGHTLALLNRWDDSPIGDSAPLEAAPPDRRAVDAVLTGRPLASFRPFTLVSLSPGEVPWLFEWDGHALERAMVSVPGLVRARSEEHTSELHPLLHRVC